MTSEEKKKILHEAIHKYGPLAQSCIAMEECAELIQAINKTLRNDDPKSLEHLVEEIADVTIMIEQLKLMHYLDENYINDVIQLKYNRLKSRMEVADETF